jgi:hypothetical protein
MLHMFSADVAGFDSMKTEYTTTRTLVVYGIISPIRGTQLGRSMCREMDSYSTNHGYAFRVAPFGNF